jgi:hypothetical protein
MANASRSQKLSEFGARAGDNDDFVFITSDSISIFLVTIVSSNPYFFSSACAALPMLRISTTSDSHGVAQNCAVLQPKFRRP